MPDLIPVQTAERSMDRAYSRQVHDEHSPICDVGNYLSFPAWCLEAKSLGSSLEYTILDLKEYIKSKKARNMLKCVRS
jgi:hypothetical protein